MIEGTSRMNNVPAPVSLDGLLDKQKAAMYRQIIENHHRLTMALTHCGYGQKIKGPNVPQLNFDLSFFVHLEHAIHFLAGEIMEIKGFLRQQCENKTDGMDAGSQKG